MFSLGVKRKVHLRSSLLSSLLSEGGFIKRLQSFEIFTNVSVFLSSVAFPVLQAFSVHIAYWLAYIYSAPWHVLLPQQPATTPLVCRFFFIDCHLCTVPQCTAVYPQQVCELWVQKEQQIRVCGFTSPKVEILFFFSWILLIFRCLFKWMLTWGNLLLCA